MTTTAQIATVPQINVIKGLSSAIWDSEWIVLDEYGDTEGVVDRDVANKLVEALYQIKNKLPIGQMDDAQKLDALAKVLAGEALPEPEPARYIAQGPISVVENLLRDSPLPVSAPSEMVEEPETVRGIPRETEPKEEATETYRKQRTLLPIKHGTRTGFQAHMRRGDPPCEDCRQANRDYANDLRLRRKPDLKPRGSARANGARPKVEKPATKAETAPSTRVDSARSTARPEPVSNGGLSKLRQALLILLPAVDEPFPDRSREIWLNIATVIAEDWPS